MEEPTDAAELRRNARKGVLKHAQIIDGCTVIDCVVENLSATGAKLRLGNPIALRQAFSLRLHNGTSHAAGRRWARGTAVGIEFEGAGPAVEAERRHLVEAVREASMVADPAAMLQLLRSAWFFGDERLRGAVSDLEGAQARFSAALEPHLPAGR